MKVVRPPTRPGVGEVEDRPEVAEAVLDRGAGEGEPGAGADAPQHLGRLVGVVLDGLGLVEHEAVPVVLLEGLDVAHGGAVGGDDDVGAGHLRLQLLGRGPGRTVVHDDPQAGREASRLGGPVADDGRRRDHQRRTAAHGAGEVGEHGGRLAEAHVEGEAAAELDGVEEAEPAERLGLVRAQLADEALGPGDRRRRGGAGLLEQVGDPAAALHGEAGAEGRALEADDLAQDLGAGQLLGAGPLGEGGGGLLEVDAVELHPLAVRPHERAGLGGQPGDVGGGELDVVEHRRPAHVAELVGADHRLAGGLDEEAQRRRGLAARQRRHPHLEAGRLEGRAGDGHQLPRLVLAQVHLAAAQAAGAPELVVQALEPDDLVGEVLRALAVGEGLLDREQPALGAPAEHGQEPGVAAVGRVELDDEGGLGHAAHLVRPLVEPLRHLGAGGDRGRERRAVEAGDEGLADVGGVADHRRGGRPLELLARLQGDGVDHGADHLEGDGARILAGQHGDRAGHGAGEAADVAVVDPGRRPAHGEVHDLALGVAVGAQAGDDAALGDEPDGRHRDPPEPADARAHAVLVALAAADGDHQPAERLLDGDRQRGGLEAVGQA